MLTHHSPSTVISDDRHGRHGFTLVELLVVIGVIALLISILMPALSAARASAQGIKCAAQMRGIAAAIAMYESDNKGSLPPLFNKATTGGSNTGGWFGSGPAIFPAIGCASYLTPYLDPSVQSSMFYICPQFSDYNSQFTSGYSYKYNRYLSGADNRRQSGGYYYPQPWKVTQVKDASTTMLLVDSSNGMQPTNKYDYSMAFRVDSGANTPAMVSAGTAYHLLEALTDVVFHKSNGGLTGGTYADWNNTQSPRKRGPVNVALVDGSVRAVQVVVNQYPMPTGWDDLIIDPNYPTIKY